MMRNFPTDPMAQHNLFIAALCEDWREAGTVTRDTPRANAVAEIARQVNTLPDELKRDGEGVWM